MELTYLRTILMMTFHSNFGLETAKNETAITQTALSQKTHR